jgi:hypothetical protein
VQGVIKCPECKSESTLIISYKCQRCNLNWDYFGNNVECLVCKSKDKVFLECACDRCNHEWHENPNEAIDKDDDPINERYR